MKYSRRIVALLLAMLSLACAGLAEGHDYHSLCQQRGLQGQDVIAWLEIPGASILEPVMMHQEDDAYYAKHGPDGEVNAYGSLYVQAAYNAADFSDPVTLVYGNSTAEQAPLGMLQQMYSGSFENCRKIWLHTAQGSREYIVFAAIPYTSIHILHYYNFRSVRRYNSFFDGVFSTRALAVHLDEDNRPAFGQDRVLILSTGLRGDPLQRYLVMAREVVEPTESDNN